MQALPSSLNSCSWPHATSPAHPCAQGGICNRRMESSSPVETNLLGFTKVAGVGTGTLEHSPTVMLASCHSKEQSPGSFMFHSQIQIIRHLIEICNMVRKTKLNNKKIKVIHTLEKKSQRILSKKKTMHIKCLGHSCKESTNNIIKTIFLAWLREIVSNLTTIINTHKKIIFLYYTFSRNHLFVANKYFKETYFGCLMEK